tara:strand:- start:153 stop:560 length:408 start_codon:yes stop_codon:yes gene_type:complete
MKKLITFIALLAITSIALFSLNGCGREKAEEITFYAGPIEGWEDIALPEGSEWERSQLSGAIENHTYIIPMGKTEFFGFMEMAMEVNGWALDYAFYEGRNFLKDENLVNISTNNSNEDEEITILIVIEPEGVYGD